MLNAKTCPQKKIQIKQKHIQILHLNKGDICDPLCQQSLVYYLSKKLAVKNYKTQRAGTQNFPDYGRQKRKFPEESRGTRRVFDAVVVYCYVI